MKHWSQEEVMAAKYSRVDRHLKCRSTFSVYKELAEMYRADRQPSVIGEALKEEEVYFRCIMHMKLYTPNIFEKFGICKKHGCVKTQISFYIEEIIVAFAAGKKKAYIIACMVCNLFSFE